MCCVLESIHVVSVQLVVFHLLYTRLLGSVWFLFCVGSLRVFDGTEKWFPWLGSIAEEVVNRKL